MISVGSRNLMPREAYATCKGVLQSHHINGQEPDHIDFEGEFGGNGYFHFIERLLWDAHSPGVRSTTREGLLVRLTRFPE